MAAGKELPGARRKRLLRQLSKVGRASLATGLMGTLFTFPSVLADDLHKHGTSLYGTPLTIDGLQDLVGSLLMLSSLPGAWLTAAFGMRLGRRKGMMVNGVVAIIGWLGVALIPYPAGILASRCVSGLALGGLSVLINAYVAELSDDDVRGMMSMSLNLAILLGQVVTVVLGYSLRYYTVAFINTLVPAAFVVFLVWLPESPSVLVLKGKDEQAMEVLLDLRGKHANLEEEVNSYKAFNKSQGEGSTWRSLLQPSVVRSLTIVSMLFVIAAFTGFLVVNANAVQMLDAAGTSVDSGLGSIVLMVVQFVGGLGGFFLLDKIGRKNVLYLGFSGMVVALGAMAAYSGIRQSHSIAIDTAIINTTTAPLHQETPPHSTTFATTPEGGYGVVEAPAGSSWGWVPLACLGVYLTAVSLGVNVIAFVLNQEYFPTAIRSQASGICFTVWTLATFSVLQLYTPMVTTMTQAGLYGFYAAVCLVGLPFTFFFITETKGAAVG